MVSIKAQAALEYLVTYGWAILAVLASIAALAYFGVLSPDNFAPEECLLPPGITCLDYEISSSRVTLVVQNNFGEDITITNAEVAAAGSNSCSSAEPVSLQNGWKAVLAISGCNNGDPKQKFSGGIKIGYKKESGLTHIIEGTLAGKIGMSGAASSSQSACQNAEDSGLCGGLDVFYGIGYRALCCSEHGLCC